MPPDCVFLCCYRKGNCVSAIWSMSWRCRRERSPDTWRYYGAPVSSSDRRVGTWIHYSLRRPDVPLANRLRMYLRGEARNSADAESDLTRLRNLADCGEICCQPESAPRRKQVVVE